MADEKINPPDFHVGLDVIVEHGEMDQSGTVVQVREDHVLVMLRNGLVLEYDKNKVWIVIDRR